MQFQPSPALQRPSSIGTSVFRVSFASSLRLTTRGMNYNAIAIPPTDGDQRWLFSKKVRVVFSTFRRDRRYIVWKIFSGRLFLMLRNAVVRKRAIRELPAIIRR